MKKTRRSALPRRTSPALCYCFDFLTVRILVIVTRVTNESTTMTRFFVTNFSVWDLRLMTGFCHTSGSVSRRRQGFAARGRPPDATSDALVGLKPTGGFQLFKRPRAWRNVAALFASSLNGDTRFSGQVIRDALCT
jgi:hypothetical protein